MRKGSRRLFNHVAWTRFPKDKPAPTIDTGHISCYMYLMILLKDALNKYVFDGFVKAELGDYVSI